MITQTAPSGRLLLKVPEAAEALGIGSSIVYRLISQGRLNVVKIDGSTRSAMSELQEFIQRHSQAEAVSKAS